MKLNQNLLFENKLLVEGRIAQCAIECAVEGECPIDFSLEPIGPIDGIRLSALGYFRFRFKAKETS